jgi:argininosuccinate lyase
VTPRPPAGGRFRAPLHPKALAFSTSLPVDRKLYREDIGGSLAHVAMLAKQGIIARRDAAAIRRALVAIRSEIETGAFRLDGSGRGTSRVAAEDIHMAIEHRLVQKVGPVGGLLHTARSRNDQVALDERLFLRTAIDGIVDGVRRLQRAFVAAAVRHRDVIVPGYTHLQQAQPILLAHHFLAYVSMLDRDAERFRDCRKRVNRSPLGAGALAGTSFPVSRDGVAKALGFDGVVENSIDAVSDRDTLIEFAGCCAVTMMHLSRFAEEMVIWSSREWGFAEIGEEFATGSSIMPQKRNPDMAELIRGKTGRVYGGLMALLTVMKGLPLAYNRDMQEDKEPMFDAAATVRDSLEIARLMLGSTKFDASRFGNDPRSDLLLATELADYLARKGMPFRKAHGIVGAIVRDAAEEGRSLKEIPLAWYRARSPLFGADLYRWLDPRNSVRGKRSSGSTSPAEVARAVRRWKSRLGK